MLNIRTASHIRRSPHLKSFRSHPTSTGFGLDQPERRRREWAELRLFAREIRRRWLSACWDDHIRSVQSSRRV